MPWRCVISVHHNRTDLERGSKRTQIRGVSIMWASPRQTTNFRLRRIFVVAPRKMRSTQSSCPGGLGGRHIYRVKAFQYRSLFVLDSEKRNYYIADSPNYPMDSPMSDDEGR